MISGKNLGIIPTEFTWLVASRDEMIWLTSELTSFYKSDDIDTLEAAGDVSSWALTNQKCSDLKMVAAFAGQSLAGKIKIDRHEGRHLCRQINSANIQHFHITVRDSRTVTNIPRVFLDVSSLERVTWDTGTFAMLVSSLSKGGKSYPQAQPKTGLTSLMLGMKIVIK